jgi:hypothetical protein
MKSSPAVAMAAILAPFAFAQSTPGAAGHWEGMISPPGQELRIQVDLTKDDKQGWTGTINIPEQNLNGFPLSDVNVKADAAGFAMRGIPGDPVFKGKLGQDGRSIAGEFTQGGNSMPFKLSRTGEARLAKSTGVGKEFEGDWEGTLDANGTKLRLIVKLANQPGGAATGTMTTVDQGGAEIPITTITQKGTNLRLELPKIGGNYTGDINKEGTQITGEWTQGPGKLPLTLKRRALDTSVEPAR